MTFLDKLIILSIEAKREKSRIRLFVFIGRDTMLDIPEDAPAEVGHRFRVGAICEETGKYQHAVCSKKQIFKKGEKFTRCSNIFCLITDYEWILEEKLTCATGCCSVEDP